MPVLKLYCRTKGLIRNKLNKITLAVKCAVLRYKEENYHILSAPPESFHFEIPRIPAFGPAPILSIYLPFGP